MNNKTRIKEIIIVEGKSDLNRLKSLYDVDVITTNGSDCPQSVINKIIEAQKQRGVILFLDPDYQGNVIRKKILSYLPNVKQCFISKSQMMLNKSKIGVAEATTQAIQDALSHCVTYSQNNESISLSEYNELNLDTKQKRLQLCDHFKIPYCNGKQLFKTLNMLNITFNQIKKIIDHENT